MPQGADQFTNAEVAQASGAVLTLAPGEVTTDAVSAAAQRLLDEPSFVAAAQRLRMEIEAMLAADAVQRITRSRAAA